MQTSWGSTKAAGGGWHLSAKLLVVMSLITIIGFTVVCATILLDMRRGEEGLARQSAENLASTIDADIARNFEVLDLSLRAVTNSVLSPELNKVSREVRNLILFDHAATARHFGALQVFDASGKLTIDASTFDPMPQSAADEDFFTAHRDDPNIGLFVSRPMLYRGAYSVVLSRRIETSSGEFRGVVAGAIRFTFFHELFDRLRLDANDVIAVFRRDGVVIMRTPFDLDIIGKNLSHLAAVRAALERPNGTTTGPGEFGGLSRMYVWRAANPQSLVVVVGRPWDSIYNVWREQAIRIGIILAVLGAAAIVVTLFLAREIHRRSRAEERLEQLATTDSLTGLRNRRKFDQQLDLEWRRAARVFEPIALLMIDVDHFKAYNDRLGHQAGDKALIAIANCIATSAQRPSDCAARYGGEEFALLLPGLGRMDALQVAETIRLRVARWTSAPAPFTVSIGIATLSPDGSCSPTILIEMADRALYEAKHAGRNQSRSAAAIKPALVA